MKEILKTASSKPKITVVVPSLNQGRFLRKCLDSILSQDYPLLEVFVIDGGSSDESLEIIRSYEKRLDYWVSEPDKGQSNAINKGFYRASGDLLAWLNADDYYLPGAFERIAEAWLDNSNAPFYFGDGHRVDEKGNIKSGFFPEGKMLFNREALLYGLNYLLQPSTFIHHRFMKQVGYLDESLEYGMDSDLWMRLSALGDPCPVPHRLSVSREYAQTKTASGSFERVEELRSIAQRHTGKAMTPGVLSYFLHALHQFSIADESMFDCQFREMALETFWKETQSLLANHGVAPNGFPLVDDERALAVAPDPLTIAVELRQVVMGVSGGIAPHIKGVLESLVRNNPQHQFHFYMTIFNRGLIELDGLSIHRHVLSADTYWDDLDARIHELEPDVLFRPYPGPPLKRFPQWKTVVFIPDLQHEFLTEFFTKKAIEIRRGCFFPVLRHAGAIGTNTEYVRQTLLDFSETRCRDIFLMPPAAQVSSDKLKEDVEDSFKRWIADIGEYFFFPSNMWPHKNHERLLQAFEHFLTKERRKVSLVLTGHKKGWEKFAKQYEHLPVHHLGFVSKAQLAYLYRHALALTFFSLYEGFGMPVLEAFEFDCPVLCSNTTALPEVGGEAVLACDPEDAQAMAEAMSRLVGSPELRQDLIEKGRERLRCFNWDASAGELAAALKRVAERGKKRCPLPSRPLVSIVTPSYNQGRFLRRTIESVLCQTYPNIEYIVIDGGSTDESVRILEEYGDRLKWISEPDRGQTDAINKGFHMSSGHIRAYLNSDDTLMPEAVETVVRYFLENPECDMVYGDANYIDVDDNITGRYKTAEYSFERLMFDCCVCQPAAFWRTDIAERVGPFDDELDFVMDYDYWLRIDRAGGTIHFLPQVLANSRLYPETKTLSQRGRIYKEIFVTTKRHGGYVDLNYFFGYWHHLLLERNPRLSGMMQRVPRAYKVPAILHHKWFHRHYYLRFFYGRKAFASRMLKGGKSLLSRLGGRGRAPRRKGVQGLWDDNWLEPEVRIESSNLQHLDRGHLAGIPAVDCSLSIRKGNQLLMEATLKADTEVRLEIAMAGKDDVLVLEFDDWVTSSEGGRRAFQVLETDLFNEDDLGRDIFTY